jgi:hypothetical protein
MSWRGTSWRSRTLTSSESCRNKGTRSRHDFRFGLRWMRTYVKKNIRSMVKLQPWLRCGSACNRRPPRSRAPVSCISSCNARTWQSDPREIPFPAKKTVAGGNLEGSAADDGGTRSVRVYLPGIRFHVLRLSSIWNGSGFTASFSRHRTSQRRRVRAPVAAGRLPGGRLPHGVGGRDARLCAAGALYTSALVLSFRHLERKAKMSCVAFGGAGPLCDEVN